MKSSGSKQAWRYFSQAWARSGSTLNAWAQLGLKKWARSISKCFVPMCLHFFLHRCLFFFFFLHRCLIFFFSTSHLFHFRCLVFFHYIFFFFVTFFPLAAKNRNSKEKRLTDIWWEKSRMNLMWRPLSSFWLGGLCYKTAFQNVISNMHLGFPFQGKVGVFYHCSHFASTKKCVNLSSEKQSPCAL